MHPIALFIAAVAAWVLIQVNIDSKNPCSAFSSSGACSSNDINHHQE